MNFSVGMGRKLNAAEAASHAGVAEECGFSHLTWVDQPNLSRDLYLGRFGVKTVSATAFTVVDKKRVMRRISRS
jgi:hypothetical protein